MTWGAVRIKEFCDVGSGSTPSRTERERYYNNGTIPWVKSGELRETIITNTEERITEAALKETSVKLVPEGALLLAMYGATVGRLGILGVKATTNQAVCHIVPNPKVAHAKFLFHALRSQVPGLIAKSVGGAQPNISQGIVKDLTVPLPPLPEQRRIADILDRAEALRAKRREALALLDQLPQAIFLEMFGDPVTNPMGWEVVALGEHTTKIGSGSTPTGGESAYKKTGISLIRSMNIRDGRFDYTNLAFIDEAQASRLSGVVVEADDVLLNITGASVARVCRAPSDVLPARVNQHVCILRPRPTLNAYFLESLLLSPSVKRTLLGVAGVGATREAITKAQIEKLEVICPPRRLQDEFSKRVLLQSELARKSFISDSNLKELFACLQRRAFRGEL